MHSTVIHSCWFCVCSFDEPPGEDTRHIRGNSARSQVWSAWSTAIATVSFPEYTHCSSLMFVYVLFRWGTTGRGRATHHRQHRSHPIVEFMINRNCHSLPPRRSHNPHTSTTAAQHLFMCLLCIFGTIGARLFHCSLLCGFAVLCNHKGDLSSQPYSLPQLCGWCVLLNAQQSLSSVGLGMRLRTDGRSISVLGDLLFTPTQFHVARRCIVRSSPRIWDSRVVAAV